jgi:hypothetical protein
MQSFPSDLIANAVPEKVPSQEGFAVAQWHVFSVPGPIGIASRVRFRKKRARYRTEFEIYLVTMFVLSDL